MIGVWCSMFNEFMMEMSICVEQEKNLKRSLDNELFDLSTNVCSLVTIVLQVAAAIITCQAL